MDDVCMRVDGTPPLPYPRPPPVTLVPPAMDVDLDRSSKLTRSRWVTDTRGIHFMTLPCEEEEEEGMEPAAAPDDDDSDPVENKGSVGG